MELLLISPFPFATGNVPPYLPASGSGRHPKRKVSFRRQIVPLTLFMIDLSYVHLAAFCYSPTVTALCKHGSNGRCILRKPCKNSYEYLVLLEC